MEHNEAETIYKSFREKLAELAQDHGLTVEKSRCKFGECDISFTARFLAAESKEDGRETEWNAYCRVYGFTPEDFGKKFYHGGKQFNICGLKVRGNKYKILGRDIYGKVFKFTIFSVKQGLQEYTKI